jgi:hypothetical protein
MARSGINNSIFRLYDYEEVFERMASRLPDDNFRYCLEVPEKDERKVLLPSLMAASNPQKPVLFFDDAMGLLNESGGDSIKYDNGTITSSHCPRSGLRPRAIGPDIFQNKMMLNTPIDGYGRPNIYLSLLRQVCANGLVAYARAFRTEISGGADIAYNLGRALESFDSDEGFSAIRDRVDASQASWASVREANVLYKLVRQQLPALEGGSEVIARFHKLTGDVSSTYGIVNPDALSDRRQRALPVKCKVYDMINFATEVATHHAAQSAYLPLQAFVGNMISSEFDLERSVDQFGDFQDFFLATGNSEANVAAGVSALAV